MKLEWIKTPTFIKKIFSNHHWDIPSDDSIYITFDDGPIPEVTPWVLSQLKKYNAKATFFCIGDNIKKHPEVFQKIINEEHFVGNHTFNHLNAWQNSIKKYLYNTKKCQDIIDNQNLNQPSKLFRPPYGKIRPLLSILLRKRGYKIIMWDVLSADYDITLSKEQCLDNVIRNLEPGSIIVFHDSLKAFPRLEYVLPKLLEFTTKKGYQCKTIS